MSEAADRLSLALSEQATFNIFSPADEDQIRVGYISTERGYIQGVGRCEANEYAKLNPGTRFIIETRDVVRYLNINEVNSLTFEDTTAASSVECGGIDFDATCKPARLNFTGGGGVGAKGIPVIGNDGSVMSVILQEGGYGYQYPPQAKVSDSCGKGAGAVVRAFTDTIVETTVIFDQPEDFEEYDICLPGEDDRPDEFGKGGKFIGKFDAPSYFSRDKGNYNDIILEYQRKLRAANRKPFWSTRKNPPIKVIGDGKESRTKYNVQHFAWGGSEVKENTPPSPPVKEVTFKVFTSGGHGRGMLFNFTAVDGSDKFTIKADNFPANSTETITKKIKTNVKYKVTAEGSYKGQGVEQGLVSKLGKKPKEIKAKGEGKDSIATGNTIFCDFLKSANDNDDLQVECKEGRFTASNRRKLPGHDSYDLEYELKDSSAFDGDKLVKVIDDSFMNRYAISPVPPSNVPGSDFADILYTFEFEDVFPYDGEYTFRAQADNISHIFLDNQLVLVANQFRSHQVPVKAKKHVSQGIHKIRVDLLNRPQIIEEIVRAQDAADEATDELPIAYRGMSKGSGIRRESDTLVRIDDDIKGGFDENARFEILGSTNNARFSKNGKKLLFDGSGSVTIRMKVRDKQNVSGLAITEIEVGGKVWEREWEKKWNASGKSRFQRQQFEHDKYFDPKNPPLYARKYKERSTVTKTINVGGRPRNERRPATNSPIQKVDVFDTLSSINKADRPLFRINAIQTEKTADFINRYGILPFDIAAPEAREEDYGGTHTIRWYDLDFPVDGNYDVEIAVDDNVNLRFVSRDGEETTIEMKGFGFKGNRNVLQSKSTNVKFFKAGKYSLTAELFQKSGNPIARGNPMALAVRISASFVERTRVVKQSWNDNPMGAAVTIDAPPIPRLELPVPKAPGRCPNNPFWTTRFPGSEYWYPVVVPKRWGKFQNKYAISPLPPLAARSTDGGGVVYTNNWDLDVPYPGFFGLRGTVDNGGRILIDGVEVLRGGYGYGGRSGGVSLDHFKNSPKMKNIFIEKGKHVITVELKNEDTEEKQAFKQNIFHTADWVVPGVIPEGTIDVVYVDLHPRNKKLNVSSDRKKVRMVDGGGNDTNATLSIVSGDATFSADGRKISGRGFIKAKLDWKDFQNIKDIAIREVIINDVRLTRVSETETREKKIPIDIAAPGTKGRGPTADIVGFNRGGRGGGSINRILTGVSDDEIKYTDSRGQNDTDATFKIMSTSPGVKAKFSSNGEELIVRGNGDVTLRLKWDDDPKENGQAVGELKIAGKTFRQRGKSGEQVETIKVGDSTRSQLAPRGSVSKDINISLPPAKEVVGLVGGTKKDGVTYDGPTIASYRGGSLGPFLTPAFGSDEQYLAEFQGTTWNLKWTGVNFPQKGKYTVEVEADDVARLRINGQEVAIARVREGVKIFATNQTAGRKTVEIELFNQGESTGPFTINPVVVAAKIDYNGTRGTGKSKSWDDNPMGISAELIPPPCPVETGGKGTVTDVVVLDPGNGYPQPPPGPADPNTGSFPVSLELESVTVINSGINYNCGSDILLIEPSNGAVLTYECDTFGRITNVNVVNPGSNFTSTPTIRMVAAPGTTPTGVNFEARPNFKVVIDPVDVPEEGLLQVTNLPGIKQTGYVNGRAYYGAVYIEGGLKFAGFFATVGEPVRVYDTLQESITAEVTTPPSAILRQGTDITANEPRLDIPDTPDQLI